MARKRLIEVRHPFFRPLWRRIVLSVLLVGWTIFEISGGNTLWALLFGAIGVFCIYEFFFIYDPANYEDRED